MQQAVLSNYLSMQQACTLACLSQTSLQSGTTPICHKTTWTENCYEDILEPTKQVQQLQQEATTQLWWPYSCNGDTVYTLQIDQSINCIHLPRQSQSEVGSKWKSVGRSWPFMHADCKDSVNTARSKCKMIHTVFCLTQKYSRYTHAGCDALQQNG